MQGNLLVTHWKQSNTFFLIQFVSISIGMYSDIHLILLFYARSNQILNIFGTQIADE